jgi:hypothetical protein
VLAAALIAAAAALAPSYAGRTDEGRRIVVETTGASTVTLVHAAIASYECERFGDVGPLRIHARARARVTRTGRFSLTYRDGVERTTVRGTLTPKKATGTLRVTGTIATGERCASKPLRFRATPR